MKRVAILQSNYLPWKGYFDLIARVDEFVFYDEVQYTRHDWRNRNLIKTPQGVQWLTVPVRYSHRTRQCIADIEIDGDHWSERHWKTITANYSRAPHAAEILELLAPLYVAGAHERLVTLNRSAIASIAAYLGIPAVRSDSIDYPSTGGRNQRLIDICRQSGATHYVSGPAAKDYLDESAFRRAGLEVEWFQYDGYRPYPQLWGTFEHRVSVIDLLFSCGRSSASFLRFAPDINPCARI
jgi:hypothetical protein